MYTHPVTKRYPQVRGGLTAGLVVRQPVSDKEMQEFLEAVERLQAANATKDPEILHDPTPPGSTSGNAGDSR